MNRERMLRRRILLSACILFSAQLKAQVVSNEQLPHAFTTAGTATIALDRTNVLNVLGLGDSLQLQIFDDTYGVHRLFFMQRDSQSFRQVGTMPEAAPYRFGPFSGQWSDFDFDLVVDAANGVHAVVSKQRTNGTDVPPPWLFRPAARCYKWSVNSWQLVFEVPSARALRIAATSNSNLHFTWESVSAIRRDTNFYFYSSIVMYRFRDGTGSLSTPQPIDSGFAP